MNLRVTPIRGKRSRSRAASAVAMLAMGALVFTACGAPSEEPTSEPTSELSEEDIIISVTAAPRSLDPAQLDGGTQAYVWGSVFDTLLYLDNDGQLQPNAVEEWEYSEDALTLTMKLRDDMEFSDGEPVTSADVKANFDRNKVTPGQQIDKFVAVESVEAPDDHTVVVNFASPDPAFLYNMTTDAGVIADDANLDDPNIATDPLGSGPYTLNTEASVAGSSYVLDRREEYWNLEAYPFKTITVKVLTDATAIVNALKVGEVDTAQVPANAMPQFANSEEFNHVQVMGSSSSYLNLADRDGTKLEPLGDVRVRQAINHAFDREPMVEKLLQGEGIPSIQQFNVNGPIYDKNLEEVYDYDPEKARELLADAGYADGFDVSLPSTVQTTPLEPTISQALGDIGIRVTWVPVPIANVTASVAGGEYPMYFFTVGSDVPPREVNRQLRGQTQNPFKWTSPEIEELVKKANAETNEDARNEIYRELNEYIVDEALFAPLFYNATNYVTSKDIVYLGNGSKSFASIRTFDVATE